MKKTRSQFGFSTCQCTARCRTGVSHTSDRDFRLFRAIDRSLGKQRKGVIKEYERFGGRIIKRMASSYSIPPATRTSLSLYIFEYLAECNVEEAAWGIKDSGMKRGEDEEDGGGADEEEEKKEDEAGRYIRTTLNRSSSTFVRRYISRGNKTSTLHAL